MSEAIAHWTPPRPTGRPVRASRRAPNVELVELQWWRHTRQSSRGADGPFMPATLKEASPWWEIDLGGSFYVETIRLELADVPAGTRLRVERFTFPTKKGEPPPGTILFETETAGGEVVVDAGVVARFVRVTLIARETVSLSLRAADMVGTDVFGDTLLDTYRRAFALFADRTLVNELRYRDVWSMAERFAGRLAAHVSSKERLFLGICMRNCTEWIAADLAAVMRGWVVVPISPDDSEARIAQLLALCPLDLVVVEDGDGRFGGTARVERSAMFDAEPPTPIAPRPRDDLYTLLFTSGSSGTPKAAMRSYDRFHAMLRTYGVAQPGFHLSFQPLSHLSERMFLPVTMIHGAEIAFSPGGARLLADLRAFEPSMVSSVPRLYEVVYASYRRRALEDEPAALAEARRSFGSRVQTIAVGSAPCSAEVLAFLRRCFADLWVMDGYGSTECGTITADGRIVPNVEVKLAPVEGMEHDETRGEIWVRTPHQIDGYFGDEIATANSIGEGGWFRTGDLGERTSDGVRVVGRVANVLKLGHGEFVAIDRIEATLAGCPGVDRIFVHPDPATSSLLAVVVPREEEEDATLLPRIRAFGRSAGLATFELPRAILVERASIASLLTVSGKIARPAMTAHYRERLEALARAPTALATDDSIPSQLVSIASRIAKRAGDLDEPLRDGLGIDSLAVAELLEAIGDALGRPVALSDWFEARSLRDLAARLDGGMLARRRDEQATADLAIEIPPPIDGDLAPMRTVLLTGATGFLGAHLLESLARGGDLDVVCLARANDDDAASSRVRETLACYGIAANRWRAIAGDLASPCLGLDEPTWQRLAREVDTILHAGATVHWLQPYDALRAANVLGTRALLELATIERPKRFHFVSTISTAPADGDESTMLSFEQARAAGGYALTKWMAETLVRRLSRFVVHRPAMITGHSTRGHHNPEDFVNRYLRACVRAKTFLDLDDARLDMTPVDFVADGIVALMRARDPDGATHHYTNVDRSFTHAALGRAIAHAGYPCEPASYAQFRAAILADPESPLRPLASFFPESGFALRMGPWPSSKTRAALASLGVISAPVDDRLIATYLRHSGNVTSASGASTFSPAAPPR